MKLSKKIISEAISQNIIAAIDEDIKSADRSSALIPSNVKGVASIKANQTAILCGKPWFEACFKAIDKKIKFKWDVDEGQSFKKNQVICTIYGKYNKLLEGERVALNFLQTLSATATSTNKLVNKIALTSSSLLDTRKTIPGLRVAQKYAVKIGGGLNQRLGLYDEILIKENHIKSYGSIQATLENTKNYLKTKNYQIEVENINQLAIALRYGAKNILLDNFSVLNAKKAISINKGKAVLEVSGNIDIHNILDYAKIGIPRISVGAITKNIEAIDFSMIIDTI